ncbi:MAG: polysaccharide deacetylase family protein [Lentisphaerae bacterium]|nr:polysaccharide deacetylase family protein [Lentisphaerota bacterium]MBT4820535.1 polysaccharide deacetylase family protein [Lentisphaerota bacterium]MBT5608478.1 polysaccharide deacetylase family protein [Lentisphaerota bacterium]MBT7062153.1 polysaccharide deacetylase family protein [Lentisphaerota bacterium]MBT7844029.1 polysaccharide deacetylase family protein [Lentisphaerota bacterium]
MKAKQTFVWPEGQQCAVSLTYDDALPVHHELVAPLLTVKKLTATFNISAHSGFTENTGAWKHVASLGHELGNHTLFHPCRREPGKRKGGWIPHYDLCDYSAQRWIDEMRVANCLLNQIDGQSERTFGNTCCQTTIGRGHHEKDLSELIDRMFVAGRGPLNEEIVRPASLSYPALGHFNGDRKAAVELQQEIERAVDMNGWIVFMFHGVGEGTHKGFIDADEHAKLIDYLEANSDRIWTASMVNVARHLKRSGYGAAPNMTDADDA